MSWAFCGILLLGVGTSALSGSQQIPLSTEMTTPTPITTTSCGGALIASSGLIEYQMGKYYLSWERCQWTIRVPSNSAIRFEVGPLNLGLEAWITFYAVNQSGVYQEKELKGKSSSPTTFLIDSTVVMVSFFSDNYERGAGFSVAFEAAGELDDSIDYHKDFNVVAEPLGQWHTLRHPPDGLYDNRELSTFVFTRPTRVWTAQVFLNFTTLRLETNSDGTCIDKLHVYTTSTDTLRQLARRTPSTGICELSQFICLGKRTDSVILVFSSNDVGTSDGFQVEWMQTVQAGMPC